MITVLLLACGSSQERQAVADPVQQRQLSSFGQTGGGTGHTGSPSTGDTGSPSTGDTGSHPVDGYCWTLRRTPSQLGVLSLTVGPEPVLDEVLLLPLAAPLPQVRSIGFDGAHTLLLSGGFWTSVDLQAQTVSAQAPSGRWDQAAWYQGTWWVHQGGRDTYTSTDDPMMLLTDQRLDTLGFPDTYPILITDGATLFGASEARWSSMINDADPVPTFTVSLQPWNPTTTSWGAPIQVESFEDLIDTATGARMVDYAVLPAHIVLLVKHAEPFAEPSRAWLVVHDLQGAREYAVELDEQVEGLWCSGQPLPPF